jgi:hypothetical protein
MRAIHAHVLASTFGELIQSLVLVSVLLIVCSGCGGGHEPNPNPSSCMGLSCALLFQNYDASCPQSNGKNYRTSASASYGNLTVFFFYLLEQYDEQGNLTTTQMQATLPGSGAQPLACNYEIDNGLLYKNTIVKECATTRTGAALNNCTSQETGLSLSAASTSKAYTLRSNTKKYDAAQLLETPSSCVDICQIYPTPDQCLSIPFTKDQTKDLDKASGILFGLSSTNDISGCKQQVKVDVNSSSNKERSVSVGGTAKACVVDIRSRLGNIQLFVPNGANFNARGDQKQFAMAPSTDESPVIALPVEDLQKKYGGKILATEGAQAYTVLTTETGCIRLERAH